MIRYLKCKNHQREAKYVRSEIRYLNGANRYFCGKICYLRSKIRYLCGKFHYLRGRISYLRGKIRYLCGMIRYLRGIIRNLCGKIHYLGGKNRYIRGRIRYLRGKICYLRRYIRYHRGGIRYLRAKVCQAKGKILHRHLRGNIRYPKSIFITSEARSVTYEAIFDSSEPNLLPQREHSLPAHWQNSLPQKSRFIISRGKICYLRDEIRYFRGRIVTSRKDLLPQSHELLRQN